MINFNFLSLLSVFHSETYTVNELAFTLLLIKFGILAMRVLYRASLTVTWDLYEGYLFCPIDLDMRPLKDMIKRTKAFTSVVEFGI